MLTTAGSDDEEREDATIARWDMGPRRDVTRPSHIGAGWAEGWLVVFSSAGSRGPCAART